MKLTKLTEKKPASRPFSQRRICHQSANNLHTTLSPMHGTETSLNRFIRADKAGDRFIELQMAIRRETADREVY